MPGPATRSDADEETISSLQAAVTTCEAKRRVRSVVGWSVFLAVLVLQLLTFDLWSPWVLTEPEMPFRFIGFALLGMFLPFAGMLVWIESAGVDEAEAELAKHLGHEGSTVDTPTAQ